MHNIEQERAEGEHKAIEQELTGSKQLAELTRLRADYNQRIATAYMNGNPELGKMLDKQKSLSGLEARAAQHDLSPREKVKQRNEERKRQRSIRAQATREIEAERVRKLGGHTTSSDYPQTSKATEDKLNEYYKTFNVGGKDARTNVLGGAPQNVQTINAATLVIGEMKT